MYSRFIFRSIQFPVPSLILNRFFSFTPIQSVAAATQLKENSSTNVEPTSTKTKIDKTKETVAQNKTVIPSTNVTEITRSYSDKIHRIVDEISKLSLVEVMDLNELLKVYRLVEERSRYKDVPIVTSTGGTSSSPPTTPKKEEEEHDDEGARPTAQSVFKVRLIKFDETKKVPVIKQVKDVVENINLVQAKKLVESIPQVLRDNLSKADAETMKSKIEAAGGVCIVE